METILQILPWFGTVLGTVFGWILNRKVNQAKSKKEIHDTFKQMYEDVSALLLTLQKENGELHATINEKSENEARLIRAVNRLSRAMEAIPLCDYHAQCPVLGELRLDEGGSAGGGEAGGNVKSPEQRGTSSGKRVGQRHPRNGKPKNSDVGNPGPSGGSRVQPTGGEHPGGGQA